MRKAHLQDEFFDVTKSSVSYIYSHLNLLSLFSPWKTTSKVDVEKPIVDPNVDVDEQEESFGVLGTPAANSRLTENILSQIMPEGGAAVSSSGSKLKKDGSQSSIAPSSYRGHDIALDHSSSAEDKAPQLKAAEGDEEIIEDGLSSITADEYVRMRLIPLIAEYTSSAPSLSQSLMLLNFITIILSVFSSVLA